MQARTIALASAFNFPSTTPVQRTPRPKAGTTDQYEDNYYPSMKLTKGAGNKYTTVENGKNVDLWFDEPYYYTKPDLKAENRYTVPLPGQITRIFNAYNPLITAENEKSLFVMNIENMLKKFDYTSLQLLKTETKGKKDVIKAAFPYGGTEHPIVVRKTLDDKYSLVDGRHRLLASIEQGFTHIPVHLL